MADRTHPLKLASLLLQYPSEELREAAGAALEVEIAPARRRQVRRLRALCDWYASTSLVELRTSYVETFDFSKQSSLHLSYHVDGDRRQRGMALLRLKEDYRAAGFEPPGTELPDYLPLMLEFAALAPDAGAEVLERHRVSLELVRAALERASSPWAPVLDVVVDPLPRLSAAKLGRVRRLAADGPPREEVGLEPFAPPEVMPVEEPAMARPLVGGEGPR